jgi:hypothetical protein
MNLMPSLIQLVFDIKVQLAPFDIATLLISIVFAVILCKRFGGKR